MRAEGRVGQDMDEVPWATWPDSTATMGGEYQYQGVKKAGRTEVHIRIIAVGEGQEERGTGAEAYKMPAAANRSARRRACVVAHERTYAYRDAIAVGLVLVSSVQRQSDWVNSLA